MVDYMLHDGVAPMRIAEVMGRSYHHVLMAQTRLGRHVAYARCLAWNARYKARRRALARAQTQAALAVAWEKRRAEA